MFGGIPRLRYVGAERWRSVLLLGLVFVLVGSAIAVAAGVPVRNETVPSSNEAIVLEQRHFARVVDNASVYRSGEVLRGKSLYLLSEAPTVTVRETVRTTGESEVTVDVEAQVVYQVQYSDAVVHRRSGASVRHRGSTAGGNVTAQLELDMRRVRDRMRELRDTFGSEARVRAVVVTRVAYGPQSSRSVAARTPITFTSKGYHVPSATKRQQYGEPETVSEPVPDRTVSLMGVVVGHTRLLGLALGLVGLVAAGTSWGYLRRVSPSEKAAMYREMMHRRYGDLIATVRSGEAPVAEREMESLQDLIFVGDDGGEPVLYFPDDDRYAVQVDGVAYGYRFGDASSGAADSDDTSND